VIVILLSIVMICATWSIFRHKRRQKVYNGDYSSQPSDAVSWFPYSVTVLTTKETEIYHSHCVVCGAYHSLVEMPAFRLGTSDAEKGTTNVCGKYLSSQSVGDLKYKHLYSYSTHSM